MDHRRFILAAFAVATLAACQPRDAERVGESSHQASGVPIGNVRGGVDVTATLRNRLLDRADRRTSQFEIERVAGLAVYRLRVHLGRFDGAGTSTEYKNGAPNPFGMLLWHQVMARFGEAAGATCEPDATPRALRFVKWHAGDDDGFGFPPDLDFPEPVQEPFTLHPLVAPKIAAACAFEGDEAARRATAGALFDAVMGSGGSLEGERAAYLTRFAADGSPFVGMPARARVDAMFQALLLNPHFLLQK